jgi:hypothetical protein
MNCEVLELALLTVEQYQIQEVLRCAPSNPILPLAHTA